MGSLNEGLVALCGVQLLFLAIGAGMYVHTRRLDADIRRLEGLLSEEQAREAAMRAHPAE